MLAIVAAGAVAVLGAAALVLDVGHAYFTKRALQASADASALAGAQALPNAAAAQSLAYQYSGSAGGVNDRATVPNVQTSVSVKCFALPTCVSANAIVVHESTRVNSFFARVLGIDVFNVSAQATACSRGSGSSYLVENAATSCPGFTSTQQLTPNDAATVTGSSGGPTPTGSVLFQLFDPSDTTCSGTPVFFDTESLSGGQASTVNTTFIASLPLGIWRWKVHYGGDANYQAADSACGVEKLTISEGD